MIKKYTYHILIFGFFCFYGRSQKTAFNDNYDAAYVKAHDLAFNGNYISASEMLVEAIDKKPNNVKARNLLASTYSWTGQYEKARSEFNKITSIERNSEDVWISAIKNELYAKNDAIALGLANKALFYLKSNMEIERLKELALNHIENMKYPEKAWFNQDGGTITKVASKNKPNEIPGPSKKEEEKDSAANPTNLTEPETKGEPQLNNSISLNNSFIIYDQRYDPMIYSSISYKRQTLAGSIIPRINYSNRFGKHGIQYDLDFYPKFSRRLYAYINYGYSNASIYPDHKIGGDLYINLPGAYEFSAGGRYIKFDTKNISVITNSLGHYRGNYYFSLRSYITPRPDNMTRISGNILVRKYLKDAKNYFGTNFGMGYSPEMRQFFSGDELLAETLLYVESQRLNLEYQFTGKSNSNIYRTNMGVLRQELVFNAGHYFWGVSVGLTYEVMF
ncbi:MAG: YaiO family outer membrane beta-barrel protein [Maribacter sp.]|nr:YaiO family outer membrane beta-barrel protein [Maribacter sp.]